MYIRKGVTAALAHHTCKSWVLPEKQRTPSFFSTVFFFLPVFAVILQDIHSKV